MAQELAQEKQATLKGLHKPMKKWFKARPLLIAQLGSFPTFWQDLASWEHFQGAQKAYRTWQDYSESHSSSMPESELLAVIQGTLSQAAGSEGPPSLPMEAEAVATVDDLGTILAANTKHHSADSEPDAAASAAPTLPEAVPTAATSASEPSAPSTSAPSRSVAPPPRKRRRKRRWEAKERTTTRFGKRALPAWATLMPPGLTQRQQRAFLLKARIDEINLELLSAPETVVAEGDNPNRSPSPPPQYDDTGRRTNSRLQRKVRELIERKELVIEELLDLCPEAVGGRRLRVRLDADHPAMIACQAAGLDDQSSSSASAGGGGAGRGQLGTGTRFAVRVPMPPGSDEKDVMGFVLGPRGNTQKRLMRETLCNVSIRGKAAFKEGR